MASSASTAWRTVPVALLRIGRATLLSAMAGLAVCTVAPVAFGWHPTMVVSGSMMPAVHVGDVVVTSPLHAEDAATVPIGSVLLAADPTRPGGTLLHRLVRRTPDGKLITKGDANPFEDSTPMPAENLRGLARVRVPAIGVPMLRFRDGDPLPAIGLVVMVVTLVAAAPKAKKA